MVGKEMNNKIELLAPAGDMEKLKTAIHFGADAVYFAGKNFGLRAFAGNFEDLSEPINYAHKMGKKAYVTMNVYARDHEEKELIKEIKLLEKLKPDGIIASDVGVMGLVKEYAPSVPLHVSTQANTTSFMAAKNYNKYFGAKRVVLARELSLEEIKYIAKNLNKIGVETEMFIHGAMCISYSGRCLLSNYLTGRDSNHGACSQPCRWGYTLTESEGNVNKNYEEEKRTGLEVQEDGRGTYFLNSKDLCLAPIIPELVKSGVTSFKIEGRMKSPYYLAVVVNAYRKLIDAVVEGKKIDTNETVKELEKSSHREFTMGFVKNDGNLKQNYKTSHMEQNSTFMGVVLGKRENPQTLKTELLVEMRNRFKVGDTLEVISPTSINGIELTIQKMENTKGEDVIDAKKVQEQLYITFLEDNKIVEQILPQDILRK